MTRDVAFANLKDGLRQTYFRMRERRIRHMPVLDENEKMVGIVSDRDLRRPDEIDSDPNVAYAFRLDNEIKVEQVMTRTPTVVSESDDIRVAVDLMLDLRHGALPVLDAKRRLAGILSMVDVLRAFRDHIRR
ncbi:MAG: CBS domain-containing protein, partial [Myxococcales bacterium]|nr:CBS domain-containing protein [Myxococcales bacterium]